MLISIIERMQDCGNREMDRNSAWRNAVRQWSAIPDQAALPALEEMRTLLAAVAEGDLHEAMQDMLAAFLWLAWKRGHKMTLDDIWNDLEDNPTAHEWRAAPPADLVEDEFLARHQQPHGDMPGIGEYECRFPDRPELHAALRSRLCGEGRYVRLAMLGNGAMGEVWECWDHQRHQFVALKRLARDAPDTAAARARLAREFQMAARLKHPGIIEMVEYHNDERSSFFTMALVRGVTLADAIRDHHQPSADCTQQERDARWMELLVIFARVCDAVAAAHAQGVIHRDLKPSNVLVAEQGGAVVFDWGLALEIPPTPGSAGTREFAGTPEYAAPEQLDGMADMRSDVFGLGAILYEMLAGRAPRDVSSAGTAGALRESLHAVPIVNPRRLVPAVSKTLDAICMKALSTDPQARHLSAAALAVEAREQIRSGATSLWRRVIRRMMSRP